MIAFLWTVLAWAVFAFGAGLLLLMAVAFLVDTLMRAKERARRVGFSYRKEPRNG